MPELPEVETTCRGLAKVMDGARIIHAETRRPDLRLPFPKNLGQSLTGKRIKAVERRAKYILIRLEGAKTLLLHLGMSGRMVINDDFAAKPAKHDHLIIDVRHQRKEWRISFNDPRRFGVCDLVADADLATHPLLKNIGIEPLGSELTPTKLAALLKGKATSIKSALLDQTLVAGLGNIYVCEALFYAEISPLRLAGKCTAAEIAKLVPEIRKVLQAAIKAGGSSLRDYVQSDGKLGYFQHQFAVYDKEGQACAGCDCKLAKTGGVQRIVQAGRSSFYCQSKQK